MFMEGSELLMTLMLLGILVEVIVRGHAVGEEEHPGPSENTLPSCKPSRPGLFQEAPAFSPIGADNSVLDNSIQI